MKPFIPIIFFAALLPVSTALAAPEIFVEHPDYKFGTIVQGKKVEHVFVLKNTGNTPLHIKQVRPSCGCTAVNLSASTIPPGKVAEIKTSFNSGSFEGNVTKTIAVDSDDPGKPTSNLSLSGTIVEEIEINPKQLNFGKVPSGTPKSMQFVIENKSGKSVKLGSATSSIPQAVPILKRTVIPAGYSEAVTVTVTPHEGDRVISGYVSVPTDNASRPVVTIPIYGSPVK